MLCRFLPAERRRKRRSWLQKHIYLYRMWYMTEMHTPHEFTWTMIYWKKNSQSNTSHSNSTSLFVTYGMRLAFRPFTIIQTLTRFHAHCIEYKIVSVLVGRLNFVAFTGLKSVIYKYLKSQTAYLELQAHWSVAIITNDSIEAESGTFSWVWTWVNLLCDKLAVLSNCQRGITPVNVDFATIITGECCLQLLEMSKETVFLNKPPCWPDLWPGALQRREKLPEHLKVPFFCKWGHYKLT